MFLREGFESHYYITCLDKKQDKKCALKNDRVARKEISHLVWRLQYSQEKTGIYSYAMEYIESEGKALQALDWSFD